MRKHWHQATDGELHAGVIRRFGRCADSGLGERKNMAVNITVPALSEGRGPVLRTLAAMDRQISFLRRQKVGATTVRSEAVEALHSLVLRARCELHRIA